MPKLTTVLFITLSPSSSPSSSSCSSTFIYLTFVVKGTAIMIAGDGDKKFCEEVQCLNIKFTFNILIHKKPLISKESKLNELSVIDNGIFTEADGYF
jgi:hypothetical protein